MITNYAKDPLAPFHTPGHRFGKALEASGGWFKKISRLDLTEIPALDWEKALQEAESLAADFYGADECIFLVQGASQGIIGGIVGVFNPGDTVLAARNCHCSVIQGLVLADLQPVFIEADYIVGWGLAAAPKLEAVKKAIRENPGFKGLIITNPTYQGVAGCVDVYRELIGERLLMIDEAHGGYLGWSGYERVDARLAADLWVQGTHKMLGSLTQTGILHLRKGRLDPYRVREGLEILTTTSPSYILLASLDLNRCFLATRGSRMFGEAPKALGELKQQLLELKRIRVLTGACLNHPAQVVDPWKLTISFQDLGFSGYEAERLLRTEFGICAEYADLYQVTFFIPPWQKEADIKKLGRAVKSISGRIMSAPEKSGYPTFGPEPQAISLPRVVMRPRAALLSPAKKMVPLREAVGRVAGVSIFPYPPGIPLLVPGELIRDSEIETIEAILGQGGMVRGVAPSGEIPVVDI
ncbi:MAG: aminotransferase class I/II-fold pyridoxal phosphate-dependent enzyme [Firmicutes bacterium]|nr:aminotransferase class I/II-fold pyridoxal phosphate-dependent enzyme [Bacillota bacterium]